MGLTFRGFGVGAALRRDVLFGVFAVMITPGRMFFCSAAVGNIILEVGSLARGCRVQNLGGAGCCLGVGSRIRSAAWVRAHSGMRCRGVSGSAVFWGASHLVLSAFSRVVQWALGGVTSGIPGECAIGSSGGVVSAPRSCGFLFFLCVVLPAEKRVCRLRRSSGWRALGTVRGLVELFLDSPFLCPGSEGGTAFLLICELLYYVNLGPI